MQKENKERGGWNCWGDNKMKIIKLNSVNYNFK